MVIRHAGLFVVAARTGVQSPAFVPPGRLASATVPSSQRLRSRRTMNFGGDVTSGSPAVRDGT